MPTGTESRDRLYDWVRSQMNVAAEMIGYDLQDIAEEERASALADYAADQMYSATGEMAEAFRLLQDDQRRQWIRTASEEFSL